MSAADPAPADPRPRPLPSSAPAPLVALYVPGDRPDRFEKAASSGADVVILDLEDAVAGHAKDTARSAVAAWLATGPGLPVQVRVNALGTAAAEADLAALPDWVAVRVPKVGSPEELAPVAGRPVHALLESAAGVEHAHAVACHPDVVSIGLGEADLHAELGISGDDALAWVRSRVVVAARAAGLPAPWMSAYPDIQDLDGLRRSCEAGRRLGMRGRTAVHPRQVPVVRAAFAPTDAELRWAREVLEAATGGATTLPDGSLVDEAMARAARRITGAG